MSQFENKKLLLIYNPNAGNGKSKKILPEVQNYFKEKKIEIETLLTKSQGHGLELVGEANFENYDGVIAAGGDGTLFEVINGYFANKSKKRIPIGVLPTGTGNSFSIDLGLGVAKWKEAIDLISLNKPRKVDVGCFKAENKTFYYLNILGLGFVSDVGKTAIRFKSLGNFSYTIGVIYQTLFLKSHQLKIEYDGKALEQENVFVEISNSRYTANFLMAPGAKIDDGYLDVTLLKKVTRRRLLACFPKVFTGEHVNLEEVDTFQAKEIRIQTDVPKILAPDGELYCTTPVEVKCLHQAVEVYGG